MKHILILILSWLVCSSVLANDCIQMRIHAAWQWAIKVEYDVCVRGEKRKRVEKYIESSDKRIISVVRDSQIHIVDQENFGYKTDIPALDKYGIDCRGNNHANINNPGCYLNYPDKSEWDKWQKYYCEYSGDAQEFRCETFHFHS